MRAHYRYTTATQTTANCPPPLLATRSDGEANKWNSWVNLPKIRVKYEMKRPSVISWLSCQLLDLVLFLEIEGHFCLLNFVMALEWFGWRNEGKRVIWALNYGYISFFFSNGWEEALVSSSFPRVSRGKFQVPWRANQSSFLWSWTRLAFSWVHALNLKLWLGFWDP